MELDRLLIHDRGNRTFLAGRVTRRGVVDLAEWGFCSWAVGIGPRQELGASSKVKTGLLTGTERAVAECKLLFRVTKCANGGHPFKMQSINGTYGRVESDKLPSPGTHLSACPNDLG